MVDGCKSLWHDTMSMIPMYHEYMMSSDYCLELYIYDHTYGDDFILSVKPELTVQNDGRLKHRMQIFGTLVDEDDKIPEKKLSGRIITH